MNKFLLALFVIVLTILSGCGGGGTVAGGGPPPSAASPGDLYVTNLFDGSVLHYDASGHLLRTVDQFGAAAVGGLAFGPDCNLYVNFQLIGAGVKVYNGATDTQIGVFAPPTLLLSPGPMAFASDGSLYVAGGNVLAHYNSSGQLLNTFSIFPTNFMTFSSGNAYLSTALGSIGIFGLNTTSGTVSSFVNIPPTYGALGGITFGPDGQFYAVATVLGVPNLSDVLRFTGTGASEGIFIAQGNSGGLGEASDLTFGGDGNLYVISIAGGEVLRYSGKDGSFIGRFATIPGPGGLPYHLLFKPLRCP